MIRNELLQQINYYFSRLHVTCLRYNVTIQISFWTFISKCMQAVEFELTDFILTFTDLCTAENHSKHLVQRTTDLDNILSDLLYNQNSDRYIHRERTSLHRGCISGRYSNIGSTHCRDRYTSDSPSTASYGQLKSILDLDNTHSYHLRNPHKHLNMYPQCRIFHKGQAHRGISSRHSNIECRVQTCRSVYHIPHSNPVCNQKSHWINIDVQGSRENTKNTDIMEPAVYMYQLSHSSYHLIKW